MSSLTNYLSKVFLIFAFAWIVTMGSAGAQPAAHLVVLRAPNFGWNFGFHLAIDGRSVESVVQGRRFHAWVPPGRHVLTVSKVPYASVGQPTSTAVDLQPGGTYVFTATWDSNVVYLHPSGVFFTPGAVWQQRGDTY